MFLKKNSVDNPLKKYGRFLTELLCKHHILQRNLETQELYVQIISEI